MKQTEFNFNKPILDVLLSISENNCKNKTQNRRNPPIYFLDF